MRLSPSLPAGPVWASLLLIGLLSTALPAAAADAVVISEIMAANVSGLRDEDGAAVDWIELRNPGAESVDLAGWHLTDDPDDPVRWTFPAIVLPPGGYLVVFASGKNRATAGAPLHTGFSLDAAGEYLALIRPDGRTVVSAFEPQYPEQYGDVSFGLDPAAPAVLRHFATPTPGATNSTNLYARVGDTRFQPDRGFYESNIVVTLTCDTPGATLRYTLNGTVPSPTNGLVYTAPLSVTNTTTLRAAAFRSGMAPSDVDTHTYIFLRDVVRQSPTGTAPAGWPATWGQNRVDYGMDPEIVTNAPWRNTLSNDLRSLPVLAITVNLPDLFDATRGIYANPREDGPLWERPVSLERIDPGGERSRQFHVNGGIRIRGGFSRATSNPKHSFRFFLRPEYGKPALESDFFGPGAVTRFRKFDLRSHQDDSWHFTGGNGEFMRDAYSRDSLLALGQVQTHGYYHHVYINGQYWGLFTTEERPEANFAADYYGGDAADYDVIRVEAGPYDTVLADGNMDAWFRLWQATTNGFASTAAYQKVQGRNPDGTVNPVYENLIDVTNLIDYMLVIFQAGNMDAPASLYTGNNNWFAARARSGGHGGFRFNLHDSENSLYGLNDDRTGPTTTGNPFAGSGFNKSNPEYLFHQLTGNPEFRVLLGDRIQRAFFDGGALTPQSVTNRYHARRQEIARAVVAESARWGDAQRAVPYTSNDWRVASDTLLNSYFPLRSGIVVNQLRTRGFYPAVPAPRFSQFGGTVAAGYPLVITNPTNSGTIYLTTDGSDPRLPGGAVAPGAAAYAAPLSIQTGTAVKARIKRGSDWSALVGATFFPTQDYSRLAVTELMYHPAPVPGLNADDFEFLELQNTGASPVDLSGLSFAEGIIFAFTNGTVLAPGQFCTLVRDAARFAAAHPGVVVDGVYSGRLDNGGERLRITNAPGNTVLSLTYGDAVPWPVAPDGLGFSLVNLRPDLHPAPEDPVHWRAGTVPGGTPGSADPAPAIPPVVIHELLPHPVFPSLSAVELYNPAAAPADIGGWFLSADAASPQQYRIPDGTVVAPGGYIVFTAADFAVAGPAGTPFALHPGGGLAVLFSGDLHTNLTGYSHGIAYGAAAPGVSLGRHVNSVGEAQFPALASFTPGADNALPRLGPVILSEVQYHPLDGFEEYVELQNISDQPVALADPARPANTWRINGMDFQFPPGVTLAPGGFALVVGIEPAAFRARHAVPAEVPVLGPFAGSLQNDGERIELQAPGSPDEAGAVPYVTVDALRYSDRFPWPASADGDGPALLRRSGTLYADDPASWMASGISPGTSNAVNLAPVVVLTSPAPGAVYLPGAAITASAVAVDPDGTVAGVEFFAGGVRLGEATVPPYSVTWTNPPAGTHYLTARARDDDFGVASSEPVAVIVSAPVPVTLVATGAVWRYLDTGVAPGAAWTTTNFNDLAWRSGPAPLGYGDGDEATVIGYGGVASNRYITSWFRREFMVTNAAQFQTLAVSVLRDDGAVVWLNGVEVFRSNMTNGLIGPQTLALRSVAGADEINLFYGTNLNPRLLVEGRNIVAVEIHQAAANSVDVSFDLRLTGTRVMEPDNDADGMPDPWEIVHGLNPLANDAGLDADRDGAGNLAEYFAGTNPRDPASSLRLRLAGMAPPVIEFSAVSNRVYTVQWTAAAAGGGWEKLADLAASPTNRLWQIEDSGATAATRVYRVTIPRTP